MNHAESAGASSRGDAGASQGKYYSSDSSSGSEIGSNDLDFTREDTAWQDVEADADESAQYISLVDNSTFDNLDGMLEHCKTGGLDLRQSIKNFGLDFYGCIKLVNYCRQQQKDGRRPTLEDESVFAGDEYLQPVLEDDAVLFNLDELLDTVDASGSEDRALSGPSAAANVDASSTQITDLKQQLEALQRQFTDYKAAVEATLEQRWSEHSSTKHPTPASFSKHDSVPGSRAPISSLSSSDAKLANADRDDDTHYFDSYSYNDIHETMLKDTVRTSTYRDFIYENKNLFAQSKVLDVGTGTGILSLFSARAGASRVFAVDNSAIISKCRENIAANGLDSTVTCVRGKIEDVDLPGLPKDGDDKVDIIVSEWMGYCLLYESMLDSVLCARDRFLNPSTGLMAPSHVRLRIAGVADSDYMDDSIGFWDEVYGFDMRAMREKIFDDVVVRSVGAPELIGPSAAFKTLDLYTVGVEDLSFENARFEIVLDRDCDGLDAWCIWFDTFFLTTRDGILEAEALAESWPGKGRESRGVAFTTGPGGIETHWRAGMCVVDHRNKGKKLDSTSKAKASKRPVQLKKGQRIVGLVGYRKRESNSRELDIEIAWEAEGTGEVGRQLWCMR